MIEAVQNYIADFSGLSTGSPLMVDFIGAETLAVQYAIISLPGDKIVEEYITGASLREFPFAFEAKMQTSDDEVRISNSGFYEGLADWFESQTEAGDLPTLSTGKTPVSIEALGWGFIYEQGESNTAIYQIQCKLTYKQQGP